MNLSHLLCTRDEDADTSAASSPSMSSTSPPSRFNLLNPLNREDPCDTELTSLELGAQRRDMPVNSDLHVTLMFSSSASQEKTQSAKSPPAPVKKRPSKPTKIRQSKLAVSSPQAGKTKAPKRKRSRKLSPKQMKRWLEKEADNSQIYNLMLDVNELKQEVQDCEMQKSVYDTRMLVARYNFSGSVLRIVDQFFKIFYDGYRANMNREEQRFLVSSTNDVISFGTAAYGRHFLFELWERYTQLFRMREFVNSSMVVMSNDPECTIVRCDGKFDGRITRETIEVIFPHILDDEELVQRVIGCKIRVPVMTLVYFDTAGRITRYSAHVDVLQGLNDLLASNPRDVVTMMANARISDACMILSAPEEMPEEMPYERLSPSSPIPRSFPIEEEDDRLALDYILS